MNLKIINGLIDMDFTTWEQENNNLYAKAVETMAKYILEELDIQFSVRIFREQNEHR